MRRITKAATLGALAIAVAGVVSPSQAQTPKEWRRDIPRDQEARVNYHGDWTNNGASCVSKGLPTLKLINPPKNGSVRFSPVDVIPPGCQTPAQEEGVFYRPNPGFVGTDQFTYDRAVVPSMVVQNIGTNTIIVTVK